MYDHLKNHPEMVIKAFEMAKLIPLKAIILPAKDPFEDLYMTG